MPTVNAANNFVSRAEGKLEGAVRAFHYDFRNKTVLDIGSSTGGFTELALKLGAKKVVAVEKGTRQMKAPLRFDPRVELHEKTDFFDFAREATKPCPSETGSLAPVVTGLAPLSSAVASGRLREDTVSVARQQPPKRSESIASVASVTKSIVFDTILADVSFVSLKKILLAAKKVAAGKTDFLVMLKPQFEARPEQLFKGVVKNEKIRREIVKDFENWLKMNGFVIMNKRDNEVLGKNGNKERFYYLKLAKKS